MTDQKKSAPQTITQQFEQIIEKRLRDKRPTYSGIFTFLFIIGINGFIAGVKIKDSDWLSKDWLGKDDVLGKDIPNGVLYILAGISLMLIGSYFAYRFYKYKKLNQNYNSLKELIKKQDDSYPYCYQYLPVDGTETEFFNKIKQHIQKIIDKNTSSSLNSRMYTILNLINTIENDKSQKNYMKLLEILKISIKILPEGENSQKEYVKFLSNYIGECINKLNQWENEFGRIENSKKIIKNAKRSSITLRKEIATTIKELPIARFRCHLAKTIIDSLEKNKEEKDYQEKVEKEIDHLIEKEILSYDESVKSKLTKNDEKNDNVKVKINQQKKEFKKTIDDISRIYLDDYVVKQKESGVETMISELNSVCQSLEKQLGELEQLNAQQGVDLDECSDKNIAFLLEPNMQLKFLNLTLQAARPSQPKVLNPFQPMSDFFHDDRECKDKPDEKENLIPRHSIFSSS